jgi:hypothetical protein
MQQQQLLLPPLLQLRYCFKQVLRKVARQRVNEQPSRTGSPAAQSRDQRTADLSPAETQRIGEVQLTRVLSVPQGEREPT